MADCSHMDTNARWRAVGYIEGFYDAIGKPNFSRASDRYLSFYYYSLFYFQFIF